MSEDKIIDCEAALARLFEYIDQELSPDYSHEMDEHLSRCRSCYSRLEFEQRLRGYLRKAAQERAPDELRNKVYALIKKL